jgi:hypothetical protein
MEQALVFLADTLGVYLATTIGTFMALILAFIIIYQLKRIITPKRGIQ